MPKVCEPCQFYSADNTPTACPTCQATLRFTLLPPRGTTPEPLPDAGPAQLATATARARAHKEGFFESLGISEINPRYIWIGFLIVVGIAGVFARQYQMGQRLKSVQPGMHISEAARLIDTNDDEGYYDAQHVRFRDSFRPDDRSNGAFEYEDGANHMLIRWQHGIVTHIENRGSSSGGGLRRSGTITIVEGDD